MSVGRDGLMKGFGLAGVGVADGAVGPRTGAGGRWVLLVDAIVVCLFGLSLLKSSLDCTESRELEGRMTLQLWIRGRASRFMGRWLFETSGKKNAHGTRMFIYIRATGNRVNQLRWSPQPAPGAALQLLKVVKSQLVPIHASYWLVKAPLASVGRCWQWQRWMVGGWIMDNGVKGRRMRRIGPGQKDEAVKAGRMRRLGIKSKNEYKTQAHLT